MVLHEFQQCLVHAPPSQDQVKVLKFDSAQAQQKQH